jgi:LCP family protein required for cell wall assembly
VSNRGYNSYNRRRPQKRITGRFYAFLTIMVALVVMLGVFFATRNQPGPLDHSAGVAPIVTATAENVQAEPTPTQIATDFDALLEENPDLVVIPEDQKVTVSDLSVNEALPSDWHNILLLGSDARNFDKVNRTDTIIIASINVNDGRIKLISVMRDMIVSIPGRSNNKINAASAYGGPKLTMKVINECFNLNITEYVLVNFSSFREVVDILGGVSLNITQTEQEQINKSLREQGRLLNLDKAKWESGEYDLKTFGPGTHLDGLQALAYARIRKIDSDYQRTERQRLVINASIEKLRGSTSVKQLMQLATSIWKYIDTNIDMMGGISLAATVLRNGIGDVSTGLVPMTNSYISEYRKENGTALYDTDFQANADRIYRFIYEE